MSSRIVILSCLALALVAPAPAQDRGPRDSREDAVRRAEAAARAALADAGQMQRALPLRAAERLREALRALDEDTALPPDRRNALRRELLDALRGLERPASPAGAAAPRPAPRGSELPRREESSARDRFSLDRPAGPGRPVVAPRLGGPAAIAAQRIASVNQRVADARGRREDQAERLPAALNEARRPEPGRDVVAIAPDWLDPAQRHKVGPRMTAKERAILNALDTPIAADLGEVTFAQAVQYLQTAMRQTFDLDEQALKEAGVTSGSPVSLRIQRASGRTALAALLRQFGLVYVVQDEAIRVTTPARAREAMTLRVYDCYILVPYPDPQVRFVFLSILMNIIQDMIEPQSWQRNGGPGAIAIDPFIRALVIKQSAEVHWRIDDKLR